MKRIKRDDRTSLMVETLEKLMHISMEGPTVEKFDPMPYIEYWLKSGQRSRGLLFESL